MIKNVIQIDRSDLEKIQDALAEAMTFHEWRDRMNSKLHLASVRWSPLTARLQAEHKRVTQILKV